MSRKNRSVKVMPGKAARLFAWLTGMILTIFLTMTAITMLGGFAVSSEALHKKIATDPQVTEEQLRRIREEVELMAEEYGFDPETVMNLISVEEIQSLNYDASNWLTEAFREGKIKETPGFNAEALGDALMSDESFVALQDPYMLKNTILQITGKVEKTVSEKAMAFREILLRAAERIAGKSVHLPTVTALLQQVPVLLLLLSAGLAGLIALLTSRKMILSLRYIGAAFASCGIILFILMGLFALAGIQPVLSEISTLVSRRFRLLSLYMTILSGGTAIVLLILGMAGIRTARKGSR